MRCVTVVAVAMTFHEFTGSDKFVGINGNDFTAFPNSTHKRQ